MSDHSISIVTKRSSYPENKAKAKEILDWLVSENIVKSTLSRCILSSSNGHAISDGAKLVAEFPDDLPYGLMTNGLEIITERQIFHTGKNGMDECICPNCIKNIASEDWDFFNDWVKQKSDNVICPLCKVATEIHQFKFSPEWGFSNLGFTFWNWSDLKGEFISVLKLKLDCEISLVYTHI